jgi:hypothetical protein
VPLTTEYHVRFVFANEKMTVWERWKKNFKRCYASEIHVSIGWVWDGGIDMSIDLDDHRARRDAEVLPWLQEAIAKHLPKSKYSVERNGGTNEK